MLLTVLLTPLAATAQVNSHIVSVNNIAIAGEYSLRGLTGYFPNPILTTISVTDAQGRLVFGLADTLRWLSPTENTEIGIPVNQVWQPLLENHRDNPSFPPDNNIFSQNPPPLLTEVRKTTPFPTSSMLVMDISGSMKQQLQAAKSGLLEYLNLLRPVDRIGLVQFCSTTVEIMPISNEHHNVRSSIANADTCFGTSIFNALMTAIQFTKNENTRRGIILYTDGVDLFSTVTPEMVIDSARVYNIPIFTIALGNNTREDRLRRVAQETGGLFFKAATADSMRQIYRRLADIMQNFYALAHTTTDPIRNNTWRRLSVTVNTPNVRGNGHGQYLVRGLPSRQMTDLELELTATTAASGVVRPGEAYFYDLAVRNLGMNRADSITIRQRLPNQVRYQGASRFPVTSDADSIVWFLPQIGAGREITIRIFAQLNSTLPPSVQSATSEATLTAANDRNPGNDRAINTLLIFRDGEPPVANATDAGISLTARTSVVDSVVAGETYAYVIALTNAGPNRADSLDVSHTLPEAVQFISASRTPQIGENGQLRWFADSLAAGTSDSITVTVQALATVAPPQVLASQVLLAAVNDTTPANNSAENRLFARNRRPGDGEPPVANATDAGIGLTARTSVADSVVAGETYAYVIALTNAGPNRADSLDVSHTLPEAVQFISASRTPQIGENGQLRWFADSLAAGTSDSITVTVQALATVAPPQVLASQVLLAAVNDTTPANNSAESILFARNRRPGDGEPPVANATDAGIGLTARTSVADSVVAGETYAYVIALTNAGPNRADSLDVSHTLPDAVQFISASRQPSFNAAGTLRWFADSLAAGSGDTITVMVQALATVAPPQVLASQVLLAAVNDTTPANNSAESILFARNRRPGDGEPPVANATDAGIGLTARTSVTDSVVAGETYAYVIALTNAGPNRADSLDVSHTLPEAVQFISASRQPSFNAAGTLRWFADSLAAGSSDTITVTVQALATVAPPQVLASQVLLAAVNDTTPANNSAESILFARNRRPGDGEPPVANATDAGIGLTARTSVADSVVAGETYAYVIALTNAGPNRADSLDVSHTLPEAVQFISASRTPQFGENGQLRWFADSLAAVSSDTITVTVQALATVAPPQVLASQVLLAAVNDTTPANNSAESILFARNRRPGDGELTDLTLLHFVRTDSFSISGTDTSWFAREGETYRYRIVVRNQGSMPARQVRLYDLLPDSISASNFEPLPTLASPDSLVWSLDSLAAGEQMIFSFAATVAAIMPEGTNTLVNTVEVTASNQDPARLSDNSATSTVFNIVPPRVSLPPLIQAEPPIIEIGDSIRVRVQVQMAIVSWDLWVYFADGSIDRNYADAFVQRTQLDPNTWYTVEPDFRETQLRTAARQEEIRFEIRTVDIYGVAGSASASVLVRDANDLVLDRNVFEPESHGSLGIRFRLNSNRPARLDVYEISGYHVTTLVDAPFSAGWNTYQWNGMTREGRRVGSGVYLITLRSDGFNSWKKVIIAQ